MPRPERKGPRRRTDAEGLTICEKWFLLDGRWPTWADELEGTALDVAAERAASPWGSFETENACRAAWDVYGERLMREFITERPTRRPWGWWRFEAACDEPADAAGAVAILLARDEITGAEVAGIEEIRAFAPRRADVLAFDSAMLRIRGAQSAATGETPGDVSNHPAN